MRDQPAHNRRDDHHTSVPDPASLQKLQCPILNPCQSQYCILLHPMVNPKDTEVEHLVADPEKVPGDASLEFKRQVVKLWPFHRADPNHFASSIGARLELAEISIVPKREDPQVMEARIAAEIDVGPGAFSFERCVLRRCTELTRTIVRDA